MLKPKTQLLLILVILLLVMIPPILVRLTDRVRRVTTAPQNYQKYLNITYLEINNVSLKLDIYTPKNINKQVPTLIYFHGGGWISGTKDATLSSILPYTKKGWGVVTVQYRLANVSLAPAAVKDSLCAVKWVINNGNEYGFDVNKIVLSGESAGGHLALITGMLPDSSDLYHQCQGKENSQIAAIINWYGITDVLDVLQGENQRDYAVEWLGNQSDRFKIAQKVSPINYIREDLPPILTIHGDADTSVPYSHAVQLHQALEKVQVPNELMTITDGGHGWFRNEEMVAIYKKIDDFLASHLHQK
ncbi:alpha/beta hydrolase [Crocosphaera chwakensis]|uniref:Alpha/beta hydrolase n=1 Tax=Crocosphaera chwakensis CCY0110 TaxID=391612 RepID=A3ISH0_9CHRO|nr:alpha/beta hydrolase [Crocosphaera chwakensis]EAZ90540.1 Alpha/beta hydrolase [Crocosphaera chwakensis CCY0110]